MFTSLDQTASMVFEDLAGVKAAQALDGSTLDNRVIKVCLGTSPCRDLMTNETCPSANHIMSSKSRQIVIRPVDTDVRTQTALWYYFKECGAIEFCKVVPGLWKTASITFYSQSAVVKAMALNKSSFQDREIQVSFVRDDGTYAPLLPSEETIKKTKPPKENDFMEHLKFTLDVFPEPNAVQNLIDVGKFVAEGGDLSTVGVHQGLTGQPCACVKCELHKKLMTAGAILSHAYMVYEEAEESSDDDSCGCEGC